MRRLLMVCFAVLCVSPCGNAEEKAPGSPAHGDSIPDRLRAVEKRLAALESRPVQHPPIPYFVPQDPPQVTPGGAFAGSGSNAPTSNSLVFELRWNSRGTSVGPWNNAQPASAWIPPAISPPPQVPMLPVVSRSMAFEAPGIVQYKAVQAKKTGGDVEVDLGLGRPDDAGIQELKGELVIDGKDVRVVDAKGKTVDRKDALSRLAKKTIVGVVIWNSLVDIDESSPPKFLKEVPDDTMVIVVSGEKNTALWRRAFAPQSPQIAMPPQSRPPSQKRPN